MFRAVCTIIDFGALQTLQGDELSLEPSHLESRICSSRALATDVPLIGAYLNIQLRGGGGEHTTQSSGTSGGGA